MIQKQHTIKDVLTKAIAGLIANEVDTNTAVNAGDTIVAVDTGDTTNIIYLFAGLALASIIFYKSKKRSINKL